MSVLRPRVWLALIALALASCDSCGCGEEGDELAHIVEVTGPGVQRDHAKAPKVWEAADLGARFFLGDGVRSDAASRASLVLADNSELKLEPGTLVRFLIDAHDGEQALSVETGEALLIASGGDLTLRTELGVAVLQANGKLWITRKSGQSADYRVEVGELSFRDAKGEAQRMRAGESMEIGIGMAMLRTGANVGDAVLQGQPKHPEQAIGVQVSIGDAGVLVRGTRGSWEPIAKGEHTLPTGTGLKLPAGTHVQLARGNDRATVNGAAELVLGSGAMLFELREGGASVKAVDSDVEVIVPGGLIVAKASDGGTQASMKLSGDQGLLHVESGVAELKGVDGSKVVKEGDEQRWTLPKALASDDTQGEEGDAPDYFNMVAIAGQSFVVHTPEVPIAIAFDFHGKCSGDGFVELTNGKQRGRGAGRASLLLQAGTRQYAARCADAKGNPGKLVARGSVTVMRDAGTGKLPPSAPTSFVEADGRSYTVYYQNQLPDISVRWPNAPKAAQYHLDIDGKTIDLGKPEHVIKSGGLRDGTHTLTFQAEDRRSRSATIEISFDNAAPKASLFAPADRSFATGSTVTIEGVALRGWKVELDGGMITTDASDRFTGQVATNAEHPDIAVRLSHPRLGTHYYVRRASGSR